MISFSVFWSTLSKFQADNDRPHLSRPARVLFRHNLTGILESAIRSSNSQYDDPDILARLDIDLLEHTQNECGWDSFCLNYHTDSPINTVITKSNIRSYGKMFCFMWKLKRLEYALSTGWRKNNRADFSVLMVDSDLHLCHVINSEMTHFVHLLQYYFQFEVIECSWVSFMDCLSAKSEKGYDYDFSALIDFHDSFLDSLKARGFQRAEVCALIFFLLAAQGHAQKVELDLFVYSGV